MAKLERQLAAHPELVTERLDATGTSLRESVGAALEGYFRRRQIKERVS